MRAKFVNEKFKEDTDPIHDMGIGLPVRYNLTIKEYENGDFNDAWNNESIQDLFLTRLHELTKNNKDLFLKKYGKQDFVWTYEYKQYAWAFELPSSAIFVVFTGNRGTSYEYNKPLTDADIKSIERFIMHIFKT
jgi:hypothetical protein